MMSNEKKILSFRHFILLFCRHWKFSTHCIFRSAFHASLTFNRFSLFFSRFLFVHFCLCRCQFCCCWCFCWCCWFFCCCCYRWFCSLCLRHCCSMYVLLSFALLIFIFSFLSFREHERRIFFVLFLPFILLFVLSHSLQNSMDDDGVWL